MDIDKKIIVTYVDIDTVKIISERRKELYLTD